MRNRQEQNTSLGNWLLRIAFAAMIVLLTVSPEKLGGLLGDTTDTYLAQLSLWKLAAASFLIGLLALLELLTSFVARQVGYGAHAPSESNRNDAFSSLLSLSRAQVWRQATLLALGTLGLLNIADYHGLNDGLSLLACAAPLLAFGVVLWVRLAPVDTIISHAVTELLRLITGAGSRTLHALSLPSLLGTLSGKALRAGTVTSALVLASKQLPLFL